MQSAWQARLAMLGAHLRREAALNRRDLDTPGLLAGTRQRLGLVTEALTDHERRLCQLLRPVGIEPSEDRPEVLQGLRTELPETQGLSSYYTNIHRDWCWGDRENALMQQAVEAAMQDGGPATRMIVLGAGSGRLAYDLHQAGLSSLTVALDHNPLLAAVGSEVARGAPVELWEFPIAPRNIADHALLRRLQAPAPARAGLEFVLADALLPPFRTAVFDLLLTPWFVDIVPQPLPHVLSVIARLLAPGGRWIMLGSLAWADRTPSECYSAEELKEMAPRHGLAIESVDELEVPYMQSPASRHGRVEGMLCLSARRVGNAPAATQRPQRPAWLDQTALPVPATAEFREQALSTRVYAFLMAMIDGKRSIEDMARLMEEQRLMSYADAVPAIRGFLARMVDDANRRANF